MSESKLADCPRIYTRCPACNNDTLTINRGRLLCTWQECPDPTRIDKAIDRQPVPAQNAGAAPDLIPPIESNQSLVEAIKETDRHIEDLYRQAGEGRIVEKGLAAAAERVKLLTDALIHCSRLNAESNHCHAEKS